MEIKSGLKSTKIIYWIFTTLIVLLDSVMPAFTFNTQLAKDGISHLGFPDWFRLELTAAKVIGGILLILPMIPARLKEWAYAGFTINFISAFIGLAVVDGFTGMTFFPMFAFVILAVSYITYQKIKQTWQYKMKP